MLKWLMAYVRWARGGATWWARWHFYICLISVYALFCLSAVVVVGE